MNENNNDNLRLHPDHYKDLLISGLTVETIQQAGIYSLCPADIPKKLGFSNPDIQSVMAIPYDSVFERYKIFPPLNDTKYIQPKGSGNRLYISNKIRSALNDARESLYATEGEKKSLKAIQEGLPTVGLGGLWNWSDGTEEKGLIPDFNLIQWEGRTVYLVPDNDWMLPDRHGERKNLREAIYELAYRLIDRGAKVFVVELPQGAEKGLDDYLCHHSVEEFKALPKTEVRKLTVEQLIDGANVENLGEVLKRMATLKETERAFYTKVLAAKLEIPKSSIKKDLKIIASKKGGENRAEAVPIAHFPGLIDLCLDDNGDVAFLVKSNKGLDVFSTVKLDGVIYKPPDREDIPFIPVRAEYVLRWMEDNNLILFNELLTHLKRFSFLPDSQFILITLYAILTHIQDHPDIHYFPMLLFWSDPERGKSRTGKAVVYCSFRGLNLADLRESNLFRFSENLQASLFIDSKDLWKKAVKAGSEDILLLRYEKGAQVPRVLYPEKGPFKDMKYFNIYGPTILATNEAIHHILDTRCIPISMPNVPGGYEKPFKEQAIELRERLVAWRARTIDQPLPKIRPIPGIIGRLWDITEPLFQVCLLVCPDNWDNLKRVIIEFARGRTQEKQATLAGEIVGILNDLSVPEPVQNWSVELDEIVTHLNKHRPEDKKLTSRYVGQRIKALSLRKTKGGEHSRTIIELSRGELNTLLEQFGFKITDTTVEETFRTFQTSKSEEETDSYKAECMEDVKTDVPNVPPEHTEHVPNVPPTFRENSPINPDASIHSEHTEHSAGGIDKEFLYTEENLTDEVYDKEGGREG